MSKICPLTNEVVLSQDCVDCEDRRACSSHKLGLPKPDAKHPECESTCCAMNPDGICHLFDVYGFSPNIGDDGCDGFVFENPDLTKLYRSVKDGKTRVCPVCGRTYKEHPAVSRRNGADICSECGAREALEDAGTDEETADGVVDFIRKVINTKDDERGAH